MKGISRALPENRPLSHERKCRPKSRSVCAKRPRSLKTAPPISTGSRISMTRYCPESVRMSATLSAPKRTEKSLRQFAAIKKITGKSQILFPVIFSMELVVRIELTTFSLRVRCSTIEPHQQRTFRILAHGGDKVKQKKL